MSVIIISSLLLQSCNRLAISERYVCSALFNSSHKSSSAEQDRAFKIAIKTFRLGTQFPVSIWDIWVVPTLHISASCSCERSQAILRFLILLPIVL